MTGLQSIAIFLWLGVALNPSFAETPPPVRPPVSLSLTMPKQEVAVGQEAFITLLLHNGSDKEQKVPRFLIPEFHALELVIKDSKGRVAPYKGPVFRLSSAIREPLNLQPGYVYGRTFDINALYELKKGEIYKIEALVKSELFEDKNIKISSLPLQFSTQK